MTRIRWLGHATVLIDFGHTRLLTDPVLRGRVAHLTRRGPTPPPPEHVDAVLVSHLHHDHADRASLRMLAPQAAIVAPAGAERVLARRSGGHPVVELRAGESSMLGGDGVRVTAVPAEHDGRRHPLARGSAAAVGFVVAAAGQRIYFAGDTDLFAGMEQLGDPPLDLALLPVWGWGASLGPGHLDPERAARAAALLRPRIAVPIHWGTLLPVTTRGARAEALLETPGRAFARHAAALAPEVIVQVMAPGTTLVL